MGKFRLPHWSWLYPGRSPKALNTVEGDDTENPICVKTTFSGVHPGSTNLSESTLRVHFIPYNCLSIMELRLTKAEVQEKATVIRRFEEHITRISSSYSGWYVGITHSPTVGLFNDHHVDKSDKTWIHTPTSSATVSRAVEKHFVKKLRTDGETAGGDESWVFVYAYLKGPNTNP